MKTVRGFMCKTDWDCEIGAAPNGTKIYYSEVDLRHHRSCVRECGIVEVETRLVKVIYEPTDETYR